MMRQPGDVLAGALPAPQPHVEGVESQVVRSEVETCQPTIIREKTSRMNAT